MKKRTDINKMITDRLIERIRTSGSLPWKKPWNTPGLMPRNLISQKNYRGINAFLLYAMGYDSAGWLTMHQVNALGGNVRKGEHATPIVFWKFFDEKTEEPGEQPKRYAMLRYYRVFNTAQCEGLNAQATTDVPEPVSSPADEVIRDMPGKPQILFGYRQACYSKRLDHIHMPARDRFDSGDEFYSTLFHELAHSTGHSSRLNRKSLTESKGFGSEPYSHEELVAEMTAGFLCGHCEILATVEKNSAAYLRHWIEKLEAEPSLLLKAGSQAQKAYDYIIGEHQPVAKTQTNKITKIKPAGAVVAPVN